MRLLKYSLYFLILLLVLAVPSFAIENLRFDWNFIQPEYEVYKSSSVNIGYSITNQETFQISCTISPANAQQQKANIGANQKYTNSFFYSAPNKIKKLQNPTSYDVTIYCDGTYSYSCGFLWLDTCYEKREWSKLLSVKINFDLNQQDKNNVAILEGYRTEIADKVTIPNDINIYTNQA